MCTQLEYKADAGAQTECNMTPLMFAAANGHTSAAEVPVKKKIKKI
jgi:hypothetical protein